MEVLVVLEGKLFFISDGPAAGPVADLVLAALLFEACPHHVIHGEVVVLPVFQAFPAAVAQQQRLVAVIAETQFTYGQLQLPQRAGLGPPRSFSPSRLVLSQEPALPPLPVQQGADHMSKFALREALEHRRNYQRGGKSYVTTQVVEGLSDFCVTIIRYGSQR